MRFVACPFEFPLVQCPLDHVGVEADRRDLELRDHPVHGLEDVASIVVKRSDFVDSLARPGGNATGFMSYEYGIGGKWLELLKEIAPGVTRVAALRDPATPSGAALFGVIQAMASSLRVEVNHVNVR